MNKTLNSLLRQLYAKDFKDLLFTIYNFMESDGYITEISALCGKDYGKEDFEFIIFDIPEEERALIKVGDSGILRKYKSFKSYIENECQTIPRCAIFVMKDLGCVVAVKLKDFNINEINEV